MEFRHYDPKALVPIFKEMRITSDYQVCEGCIFTDVSPAYCAHPEDDFRETSVQSDCFCRHCCDTIEESRRPFHLHKDPSLTQKKVELEEIIKMASS